MFNNKSNTISKKKNYTSFFLSFLFVLTFILILFNKTDYFLINNFKGISLDYATPITGFIASPIDIINNVNSGSGSLSKIINEDELYNNLNGLIVDARSIVDDVKNNPTKYLKAYFNAKKK